MAKINANWKILPLCLAFAMSTGANATAASSAATLYAKRCVACHGQKGDGDGPTAMLIKRPPVFTSRCCKLVSDQLATRAGSASRCHLREALRQYEPQRWWEETNA
jgi:hypothetical protein